MSLSILAVVQHHCAEGLGDLRCWAGARGIELVVYRADLQQLPSVSTAPVVLLGGPYQASADLDWLREEREWLRDILALHAPVFAICLGAQLLTLAMGGEVYPMKAPETGWTNVRFDDGSGLDVLNWHDDTFSLPSDATLCAQSAAGICQMFSSGATRVGLQFHPEWNHESVVELNAFFGDTSPLPRKNDADRFAAVSGWFHSMMDDWTQACKESVQ
jgi:GMP synthase-like glutamine amidotransferase